MLESDRGAVEPSTVGIAGAGVMGRDLARLFLTNGFEVILLDRDPDALERARAHIRGGLRGAALTGGLPPGVTPSSLMARIRIASDVAALAPASIIVENISELPAQKAILYREMEEVCASDAVFAANSSTITVDELAGHLRHPERLIGIHFMNPAHLKPAAELIIGPRTGGSAVATIRQFLARLSLMAIAVPDAPGFVSNRLLMLTINEAIRLVAESGVDPETVDRVCVNCFGHQMGPLATADLIGLDTILLSLESLQERLDPQRFEPAPLLLEMVKAGRLGRKSGGGFFTYDEPLGNP